MNGFAALPEKERRALAIETRDPLIIESLATAPHYLSGLQPDIWEITINRVVEEQNGPRLEILDARERGYEELNAVVKSSTPRSFAQRDFRRETSRLSRRERDIAPRGCGSKRWMAPSDCADLGC